MPNVRTEFWNGHEIRFVEISPGEWEAVANDVCKALSLKNSRKAVGSLPNHLKGVTTIYTPGGEQEVNTIKELGIYRLVFKSRKPEAEAFQDWVFEMLKTLRQASGLEGFQIFRMLDKEHQKEAMAKLKAGLKHPVRVDFIKANTIADKAVSTKFGYPKMLKKSQMTPEMLVHRQPILEDTVELMSVVDRFGLQVSVSEVIYQKYAKKDEVS